MFSVVKNESLRLPFFIDYYRSKGVKKFFFIDNFSDDSTVEILSSLSKGDIHIYSTQEQYGNAQCGQDWINWLLDKYGRGHWCIVADADEILVYPGWEKIDFTGLKDYMEEKGQLYLHGFLLEMYSDKSIRETVYLAGQNPFEVCPYFDSQKPPILRVYVDPVTFDQHDIPAGGMRKRVFGVEPCLSKNIFFKYVGQTRLDSGCHIIRHSRKADIEGVVCHFKYYADFITKALVNSQAGNHWQNSIEYKGYAKTIDLVSEIKPYGSESVKFENSRQLRELGFLKSNDDFEKFVKNNADRE